MAYDNQIVIKMDAKSQNESFARMSVAAFVTELNPTVADITDIKTAVSEAVTNAIIHGYNDASGIVTLLLRLTGNEVYIEITDDGIGIENIPEAMSPMFTSKPELERSGLGFTVMETFMDSLEVVSQIGKGTTVILRKNLS